MTMKDRLASNWKSGVTVSLVSIPLSISLALAAGASPLMGIITAVWAGLLASLLGGSNYNIVGPTGALSGVLATYAFIHGVQTLPFLAILSGVLILVVFLLKLERFIVLIPGSVVHGFTLGVAFIIGLNQLNFALNLTGLHAHERFVDNLVESLRHLGQADLTITLLTIAGLVFLLLLSRLAPKIPGVIILAAVGIGLGLLSQKGVLGFALPTLATKYGTIPAKIVDFPHLSWSMLSREAVSAAFTIMLIAILETLISAKIADGMTRTKFNQRKELFALAVANIGSGLFGGIPATAALARTALNVNTGANHKTSATISSVMVAVISLLLLPYFKFLPLAMVAAILIYVAIRMIKSEHYIQLYRFDKQAFLLTLIVAAVTIIWDPIVGIGVGIVISLLSFVNRLATVNAEINLNDKEKQLVQRTSAQELESLGSKGDLVVYRFAGELAYINAQAHIEALRRLPKGIKTVILSMRNLYYVDLDGLESLAEIIDDLRGHHKKVVLTGIGKGVQPLLEKAEWYHDMIKEGDIYETTPDALSALKKA